MKQAAPQHLREHKLFCCICEASCGLVATVEGTELRALRPDPDHPNSQGFACAKGVSFGQIRRDPDRLTAPMKRQADGSFSPVTWDEALDDIGDRLRSVIDAHGKESIGLYFGNPLAWNYAAHLTIGGLVAALGTKHYYGAGSLDINNYWVVSQLLYGHNLVNPFPDLPRNRFLIIIGANPVVSHGSMLTTGRIREQLLAITDRGGRVVVVDPRRTETAALFEHIPIQPDSDAWLLAAMLKVVLDESLEDSSAVAAQTTGWQSLRGLVASIDVERAAVETGIPARQIAQLARDFVASGAAAVYGRCGASLGRYSTLTKYLIDVLNIVTGNLDRPGGTVFGKPMIDLEPVVHRSGGSGYDRWRTRVDGIPEVMGTSPMVAMPKEIVTPGKGSLRALISCSGNFCNSAPGGEGMSFAVSQLDLFVSLDLYLTETNLHAHYILPPTLWLERDNIPIFTTAHSAVPYAQWTAPLLPAPPGVRHDWWILDQIARRIGLVPSPVKAIRWLGRLGVRLSPRTVMDMLLRLSPHGDLYGLRPGGLNRRKLWESGGGIKLVDQIETGVLRRHIYHKDRLVHLDQPRLVAEIHSLVARRSGDPEFPMKLISMRELRSHNTWMHNIEQLMAPQRTQKLRVHPEDAERLHVATGDQVELATRHGSVKVTAYVTEDVMPGVLALPHGWGHRGGWRRAVASGGASYNALVPLEEFDQVSGQAFMNGIPARLRRLVA